MINHIALYSPQIPANTGNISRTAAATNAVLHLIHPLGFKTSDKYLKRAGLDYWNNVKIVEHDDLASFMEFVGNRKLYLITKFAPHVYSDVDYSDKSVEERFFLFGQETKGLPEDLMQEHKDSCIRIPMDDTHVRSLNLSNAVNIVLYEVLRQQNFESLELVHTYRDTDKARRLNW